jgi:WD40 repeat protein
VDKFVAHRDQPIPQLTSARPDVPERLDLVFQRAVAKRREDRYQSMIDFADALSEFHRTAETTRLVTSSARITEQEQAAGTEPGRAADATRGRSWVRAIAALVLVGAAAVLGVYSYVETGKRPAADLGAVSLAEGELRTDPGRVKAVAFSPDGRWVLSAGGDESAAGAPVGTVRIRRVEDDEVVQTLRGHGSVVQSMAISADGRYVLSGGGRGGDIADDSADFSVRLWNWETGKEIHRFDSHTGQVRCLACSPKGLYAVSGSRDGTIRLYDLQAREEIRQYGKEQNDELGEVLSVAFSPDGRQILSGHWDVVHLWDFQTGEHVQQFVGHDGPVRSVSFSADGQRALTAGTDETIRLWSCETGKELAQCAGHDKPVACATFVLGGRCILSAGADGTVRLWDVSSRKEIQSLQAHIKPINSIAVAPDGRRVLSGSEDRTVRFWSLQISGTPPTD